MKIGIFAPNHNSTAKSLNHHINSLSPDSAFLFDISLDGSQNVVLEAEDIIWDGTNLAELDTAFVHGFSYADPVVPSGNPEIDWSVWQADYVTDQQKYSFLYSLFRELERRGVQVINPPQVHLDCYMKSSLLEKLRQNGFCVPSTVCTNDRECVDTFRKGKKKVVWRPDTGRGAYQLFLDGQRDDLIKAQNPPVILAEGIEGPLIRGYVFDGMPLLCLGSNSPKESPIEMLEQFWEVSCPEANNELARLAELLDLRWAQVLFVLQDDKLWIYDVDSDPILDWLPEEFKNFLLVQLSNCLLDKGIQEISSPPTNEGKFPLKERPAFFLRRMLQMLFDFERSKYP